MKVRRSTWVGCITGCGVPLVVLVLVVVIVATVGGVLYYTQYRQATNIYAWTNEQLLVRDKKIKALTEELETLEGKHAKLRSDFYMYKMTVAGQIEALLYIDAEASARMTKCGCPTSTQSPKPSY